MATEVEVDRSLEACIKFTGPRPVAGEESDPAGEATYYTAVDEAEWDLGWKSGASGPPSSGKGSRRLRTPIEHISTVVYAVGREINVGDYELRQLSGLLPKLTPEAKAAIALLFRAQADQLIALAVFAEGEGES